ncbi:DUF4097 family beta strand repeat-containing protein [Cognaticolwellia aestuarii]|uniref:DUF4097 family beta strand repeat-containing protein n=1 Tax=Cognaticolwellia aestuarii TaxID=329993 RepID=UPI0009861D7F|nr:DUF4097 family beta strand repeat-containing protein [Cognaticolwellia aestuarii]
MNLAQSLIFITSTALLSGCIVVANPSHANYHSQQELSIDAQTLRALDVEAGAGSLVISGSDNATDITVVADIYTDRGHAENYRLELTDSGDSAFLVATINTSGFWQGDSPRIDIKVTMPSHLMLQVDDGSGPINISHIYGAVDVKDGSGELTINDIKNDLSVNDGSGSLTISEVIGNVSITDGSGEIVINEIDGNIDIDDGSGSIYVSAISGEARFEDGSGDLTVRKVDGVITIDDGSGDIDVEQAGGLKILESGSGGLRVKKVKGGFEIDQ